MKNTSSDLISLAEAAHRYGLSMAYLRQLAMRGRLAARKIGRNWVTTSAAVEEYIASRQKRGSAGPTGKIFAATRIQTKRCELFGLAATVSVAARVAVHSVGQARRADTRRCTPCRRRGAAPRRGTPAPTGV
jgi:hypothetical protein